MPPPPTPLPPIFNERKYYQLASKVNDGSPYPNVVRPTEKRDSGQPYRFPSPPQLIFQKGAPTSTWQDVYRYNHYDLWLVSDRIKILLEQIDSEAFSFHKTEIDYSLFLQPGPIYWVAFITRELDCVDEERSKIKYQKNILPEKNYISLDDVKMRPEAVGSAHAFRLTKSTGKSIVDDIIARALEKEKVIGFRLRKSRSLE